MTEPTPPRHPEKDYEIGYGKPPKRTQFKKGQTGNPKGRRRGSRNLKTDLEKALKARLSVTKDGKRVSMSTQQALIARLMEKALKGDIRALREIIDLAVKHLPDESDQPSSKASLPEDDAAIINRFLSRQAAQSENKGGDYDPPT